MLSSSANLVDTVDMPLICWNGSLGRMTAGRTAYALLQIATVDVQTNFDPFTPAVQLWTITILTSSGLYELLHGFEPGFLLATPASQPPHLAVGYFCTIFDAGESQVVCLSLPQDPMLRKAPNQDTVLRKECFAPGFVATWKNQPRV